MSEHSEEELNDDDRCPDTGLRHVPDWSSLRVQNDVRDTDVYIDVTCKDCGRSGCLSKLAKNPEEVNW